MSINSNDINVLMDFIFAFLLLFFFLFLCEYSFILQYIISTLCVFFNFILFHL